MVAFFFYSTIKDIFCPQILEGYKYFIERGSNLIPTSCSQVLFFLSRFQIPWIVCWDLILTQMIPTPFATHLAREFKAKWWSSFSHTTKQICHIRNWISSKNAPSKSVLSKSPFQINLGRFMLSRSSFPSYKEYKKRLKMLQQKALETLS